MDALRRALEMTDGGGAAPTLETILLSLLLAFVLGQLLAWAYCRTHNGLSYSRSFTQSLILMTMVVALVMIVIGNNIVTAFGLIGALAIIRFRNVLKDTRDTVFVFLALVQGMGVGSGRYLASIVGMVTLLAALFYIHWTDFGSRGHFDGFLRCGVPLGNGASEALTGILKRHCRATRQLAAQESSHTRLVHCTFQVRLRDVGHSDKLITELKAIDGLQDVSLILQEDMGEV